MYDSYAISLPDQERMHPKDERLTLLAYKVGKMQYLEEENRVLRKELQDARIRAERAESESKREQSIRENYYALQRKYDNLKKKTTKKKVVKK